MTIPPPSFPAEVALPTQKNHSPLQQRGGKEKSMLPTLGFIPLASISLSVVLIFGVFAVFSAAAMDRAAVYEKRREMHEKTE